MKELQDIVKAFYAAQNSGRACAIATVVQVDGSSYRRAGARMLMTEDGQLTGAISGGCLEGDALRKARLVMLQQKPMLVIYDTTDEDDAKLGVQLGCTGIIHILIEPVKADQANNPINFFERYLSKREPVVIVTIFNAVNRQEAQFGTCLLVDGKGYATNELPGEIHVEVLNEAIAVLHNATLPRKKYHNYGNYTCFIELLQPAISLVVVGAGNDALPLIQMAKVLGWEVTLVDGRANYNTAERFPIADRRLISRPEDVLSASKPDSRTAFMLMTHNYNYDRSLLKQLLPLALPYIGVLGPKKRLIRILDEIDAENPVIRNASAHVYGPAGLDIGSENAEQIALSILSEIQAVFNQLGGGSLRDKAFIHDRSNEQVLHHNLLKS